MIVTMLHIVLLVSERKKRTEKCLNVEGGSEGVSGMVLRALMGWAIAVGM